MCGRPRPVLDALVLRPPFAYMARFPDAGFLTTSDHLRNTTNDDGLETHDAQSAYNIGYMLFRPSALPLVDEWLREPVVKKVAFHTHIPMLVLPAAKGD